LKYYFLPHATIYARKWDFHISILKKFKMHLKNLFSKWPLFATESKKEDQS